MTKFSASQALAYDEARCANGEGCQHADVCLRFLSIPHSGPRTPYNDFRVPEVVMTGKCDNIVPLDPDRPPRFLLTPKEWEAQAIRKAADCDASMEEARASLAEARRYRLLGIRIKDLEAQVKDLQEDAWDRKHTT